MIHTELTTPNNYANLFSGTLPSARGDPARREDPDVFEGDLHHGADPPTEGPPEHGASHRASEVGRPHQDPRQPRGHVRGGNG